MPEQSGLFRGVGAGVNSNLESGGKLVISFYTENCQLFSHANVIYTCSLKSADNQGFAVLTSDLLAVAPVFTSCRFIVIRQKAELPFIQLAFIALFRQFSFR
jgi:hypothetical protein